MPCPLFSSRSTVPALLAAVLLSACGDASISKQTFVYKTVDGVDLHADVFVNPSRPPSTTLMWIHGGGLIQGSRTDIPDDEIQWWTDAGYRLVLIDYRLAPETKLDAIYEDVQDAWNWMQVQGPRLFGVDPADTALLGQSAGGYLALTGGYRLTPRPRVIVSFYGYGRVDGEWVNGVPHTGVATRNVERDTGDVLGMDNATGRRAYNLNARASGTWTESVVGDACASTDRECLKQYNPEAQVNAGYPATILIHGEEDEDVPVEESRRMARLFEQHHVDHELFTIALATHGFDTRGTTDPRVISSFEHADRFLRGHR